MRMKTKDTGGKKENTSDGRRAQPGEWPGELEGGPGGRCSLGRYKSNRLGHTAQLTSRWLHVSFGQGPRENLFVYLSHHFLTCSTHGNFCLFFFFFKNFNISTSHVTGAVIHSAIFVPQKIRDLLTGGLLYFDWTWFPVQVSDSWLTRRSFRKSLDIWADFEWKLDPLQHCQT